MVILTVINDFIYGDQSMQLVNSIKKYPMIKVQGIVAMLIYFSILSLVGYFFWMTRTVLQNDPAYLNPSRLEFNANLGDPKSQYLLGMLYFSGHNVVQDDEQALFYLKRAAGNGYAEAQFQVCTMLEQSEPKVAFNLCTHAAVNGHREAAAKVGYWYIKGPPSDTPNGLKGATFLNMAAERGHSVAMYNLALLYKDGAGVTPDFDLAYYWLGLALLTEKDEEIKSNILATKAEWDTILTKKDKNKIDMLTARINERFKRGFKP